MRWERLEEGEERQDVGGEISGPGKRWGHTCNAIKEGRFLYVFGGYGKLNCQTNQVHVFDTVTQKWSQPVIKGTPPTPRDSHTCTTVGDNLYVFGGTDGMRPLKDLYILDTSSHTWIQPSLRGEGPEAREGHSAALIGKRLFVFGGCGKSLSNEEIYYNDLYVLNTETFVWKRAITSGTPPSPRDSHTCSSWKNNLIVIGGEDGHDYYLADVHILDTDTLVWRELNTSGYLLTPRAGHCTVSFGKKLFVFGGFTDAQNLYNDLYMLDIDTAIWTKIVTVGDGPSARFSVAGDCLDPQRRGVLMFLGGCNKSLEALDDMHYLYTGISREVDHRLEKLSLRKQLKLKCQEQSLTPIQGHPFVGVGAGSNIYQPMTVPVYGQPYLQNVSFIHAPPQQGKKTFQARVTERITDGYTIETTIDGKPLRGILFSNRQNLSQTATPNSTRKRAAEETQGVVTNGSYNTHAKPGKVLKPDSEEQKQAVNALAKEPIAKEPNTGGVAVILKDQTSCENPQAHEKPWKFIPMATALPQPTSESNDPVRHKNPLDFEKLQHGCKHYRRRCKIRAPCCNLVFCCHHCHNEANESLTNSHELPRHNVEQVICSICETEQEVAQDCVECGVRMGEYFCGVCKFHDDDTTKRQFHCKDCGICRGGGQDNYYHCQTCGSCYEVAILDKHKCIENSMKSECPICREYLFDSIKETVILNCGHPMHLECHEAMKKSVKWYCCPVCSKSIFDMSNIWEIKDREIQNLTIAPERRTKVKIICNDCNTESITVAYSVGLKCNKCGSFNTWKNPKN